MNVRPSSSPGDKSPQTRPTRGRQQFWWTAAMVIAAAGILAVVLGPTFIARSAWGRQLLARAVDDPRLRLELNQCRLGWWSPVTVGDVALLNDRGEVLLRVGQLQTDVTLWQLLFQRPGELHITIDQPEIPVYIHPDRTNFHLGPKPPELEETPRPGRPDRGLPIVHVHIRHAKLTVSQVPGETQAVIPDVSLDLHWQEDAAGRILTIDPVRLLDHVAASPALCSAGIQYIAPVFAEAAWVEGDLSLTLERCVINVDQPADMDVAGQLELHAVSVGPQGPIIVAVRDILSQLLDQPPITRVKLAQESVVPFQVHDRRVEHTGLAFGLPEVAPDLVIRTSGSVSFDKQLDMMLSLPLPFHLFEKRPVLAALGKQELQLPITGTLQEPEVAIRGDGAIMSQFLANLLDPALQAERQRRRARGEAANLGEADLTDEAMVDTEPRGESPDGRRGRRLGGRLRNLLQRAAETALDAAAEELESSTESPDTPEPAPQNPGP